MPNINTNYRKVVVKIKGNFVDNSSEDYKKIYSFIKKYGKHLNTIIGTITTKKEKLK